MIPNGGQRVREALAETGSRRWAVMHPQIACGSLNGIEHLWLTTPGYATMLRMRGIRLLLLACLLALVLVVGTTVLSGPADPTGVEYLPESTETAGLAADEERQDSAGIAITMTGEQTEGDTRRNSVGIGITMTGEEEDGNGAWARVDLMARTGSPDGG